MKFLSSFFLTFSGLWFLLTSQRAYSSDMKYDLSSYVTTTLESINLNDSKLINTFLVPNSFCSFLNRLSANFITGYLELNAYCSNFCISSLYQNQSQIFHAYVLPAWVDKRFSVTDFFYETQRFLGNYQLKILKDEHLNDLSYLTSKIDLLVFHYGNSSLAFDDFFKSYAQILKKECLLVFKGLQSDLTDLDLRSIALENGYDIILDFQLPVYFISSDDENVYLAVLKKK